MRFGPANVQLRRAQVVLILAVLVPTVLMTTVGIVLLALGREASTLVAGVLVLTFCTTSITGYILGSIFVGRGASLVRVQNNFLSSVSHELRTPLTSIRLFIESLADGRLAGADQKRVLELLGAEVVRLDTLVGRLMELTRLETGAHLFERARVEVGRHSRLPVDPTLVARVGYARDSRPFVGASPRLGTPRAVARLVGR
ncbi:MAG TPA: histidine kinase dimerization/phospho-acceptor domain-containing protein, partial [Polyangia bacterium]